MDKKQNPETTDKQAPQEVKDETLDQVHGGCKSATAAPAAAPKGLTHDGYTLIVPLSR